MKNQYHVCNQAGKMEYYYYIPEPEPLEYCISDTSSAPMSSPSKTESVPKKKVKLCNRLFPVLFKNSPSKTEPASKNIKPYVSSPPKETNSSFMKVSDPPGMEKKSLPSSMKVSDPPGMEKKNLPSSMKVSDPPGMEKKSVSFLEKPDYYYFPDPE